MKTVLIIEVDQVLRRRVAPGLIECGWSVLEASDQDGALALTRQHQPDMIVCDWRAPWFEIAHSCRGLTDENQPPSRRPILVALGEAEAERMAALESGADEYTVKSTPPQTLGRWLARLSRNGETGTVFKFNNHSGGDPNAYLRFWGVRGSIATPGPETVNYGGNTSCVEIRIGGEIIILDAGTGIRKLGLALVDEFKDRPINLNLLITHTHWDHIQGFPFFTPAYNPNNVVTVYGFEGARQGLQNTLSSQMENPYFPISMQQMPGHIAFRELKEMNFRLGAAIQVKAHFMNHPGVCVGYRLWTPGGSIAYLPDVELFQQLRTKWRNVSGPERPRYFDTVPEEDRSALDFIRGCDILMLDSQYDAREYEHRIGWGHSCFEDSVTFAIEGGARHLVMFHHDPDHADDKISRMVAQARAMARRAHSPIVIQAAREGHTVPLAAAKASV